MSEICEEINDCDSLNNLKMERPSMGDNRTPAAKSPKILGRKNDENDKWKEELANDDLWYLSSPRVTDDVEILESEKAAGWKYKNVYSMSVPNDNHMTHWIPRQATITTRKFQESSGVIEISGNLLQEKFDTSKNEIKNSDLLDYFREYLASYQETNGTPRGEYSFVSLMKVMGQATGHSLVALFYIVVNVSPLIQLLLFILRFVLDKLISIRNMGYSQQSIVKYVILGGQLACIYVCLVFIFGFIIMPIFNLVLAIVGKMLLIN